MSVVPLVLLTSRVHAFLATERRERIAHMSAKRVEADRKHNPRMRIALGAIGIGSLAMASLVACGGAAPPPAPPEQTSTAATGPALVEPAPVESAPQSTDGEPVAAEHTQQPSEQEQPDVPPEGSSLDRLMQAHFNDALLIRKAVIEGRSEDASYPATVIANIEDMEKLPEGWSVFVEQMQTTAKRITNSTTAPAVAAAAADLGVSCGLCHQRFGGPKPSKELAPTTDATFESQMKHHIWATERLWEGLAVPSGTAWDTGAKALTAEPFPPELLKKGGVDVRTAANDFTKLAAKAPLQKTIADRAGLYAELLVTCGTCHQAAKAQGVKK